MATSPLRRLGPRYTFAVVACLVGLLVDLFILHTRWVGGLCFGFLLGNLLPLIPRQEKPCRPLGLRWKAAWTLCVVLALASFVAALFRWPTLGWGFFFTIIAAWGLLIYRYRNRMLKSGMSQQLSVPYGQS